MPATAVAGESPGLLNLLRPDDRLPQRLEPAAVQAPHVVGEPAVLVPELLIALLALEQTAVERAHASNVLGLVAAFALRAAETLTLGFLSKRRRHVHGAAIALLVDPLDVVPHGRVRAAGAEDRTIERLREL